MKDFIKKEEPIFEAEDAHVLGDDSPDQDLGELPRIAARQRKPKVAKRRLKKGRKRTGKKTTKARKTTRRKKKTKSKGNTEKIPRFRREKEPKLQIRQNDLVMVQDEEPPKPKPRTAKTPKKKYTAAPDLLSGILEKQSVFLNSKPPQESPKKKEMPERKFRKTHKSPSPMRGQSPEYEPPEDLYKDFKFDSPSPNNTPPPPKKREHSRHSTSRHHGGHASAVHDGQAPAQGGPAPVHGSHAPVPDGQAPAAERRPPALMDLHSPYLGHPVGQPPGQHPAPNGQHPVGHLVTYPMFVAGPPHPNGIPTFFVHQWPHPPHYAASHQVAPHPHGYQPYPATFNKQQYEAWEAYQKALPPKVDDEIPPEPPRDNPNDPPPGGIKPKEPITPVGGPKTPSPKTGPKTPPGRGPPTPPKDWSDTPGASPVHEDSRPIKRNVRMIKDMSEDDREDLKWSLSRGPGKNNRHWATYEYDLYTEWLAEVNINKHQMMGYDFEHMINIIAKAARKFHWEENTILKHVSAGFDFYTKGPGRYEEIFQLQLDDAPNPPVKVRSPDFYSRSPSPFDPRSPSYGPSTSSPPAEDRTASPDAVTEANVVVKEEVPEEVVDVKPVIEAIPVEEPVPEKRARKIKSEEKTPSKKIKTEFCAFSGGLSLSTLNTWGTHNTTSSSDSSDSSDDSSANKIPKKYQTKKERSPAERPRPTSSRSTRHTPARGGSPKVRRSHRKSPVGGGYKPARQYSHFPAFGQSQPYDQKELYHQRQMEIAMHRERIREKKREDEAKRLANRFEHPGRFDRNGPRGPARDFAHIKTERRNRTPPRAIVNRNRVPAQRRPPSTERHNLSPAKHIAPAERPRRRSRTPPRAGGPTRIGRFQDHRIPQRGMPVRAEWNGRPDRIRRADGR